MTTKEFIRRSDYYSLLNDCPYLHNRLLNCCYRVQLVQRFYNSVSTHYISFPTLHCFGESELECCESIYMDFYSFAQFVIDMRYFKAFISRLSHSQMESLKASGKCSNLIEFVLHNDNSIV